MHPIILGNRESITGIPRKEEGFENHQDENLLPCWKCSLWRPWTYFGSNSYVEEVKTRGFGHFKCCTLCEHSMCVKIIKLKTNEIHPVIPEPEKKIMEPKFNKYEVYRKKGETIKDFVGSASTYAEINKMTGISVGTIKSVIEGRSKRFCKYWEIKKNDPYNYLKPEVKPEMKPEVGKNKKWKVSIRDNENEEFRSLGVFNKQEDIWNNSEFREIVPSNFNSTICGRIIRGETKCYANRVKIELYVDTKIGGAEDSSWNQLTSDEKGKLQQWISDTLEKNKYINRKCHSYALKHCFEGSYGGFHISNDTFKEAMISLGYEWEALPNNPNWFFNITQTSIEKAMRTWKP